MAYLKDIVNSQFTKLNHVETVLTKENGIKINESTGEVLNNEQKEFFVNDTSPDESLHGVVSGLFIGSQDASANLPELCEKKITHILNVASNCCKNHFPEKFVYKNIEMRDTEDFNISSHFEDCSTFIDNTLRNDGIVLCHCNAGVSRSATIVAAYLMTYQKMTLKDALFTIKKNRPSSKPNKGFLKALQKLEEYQKN